MCMIWPYIRVHISQNGIPGSSSGFVPSILATLHMRTRLYCTRPKIKQHDNGTQQLTQQQLPGEMLNCHPQLKINDIEHTILAARILK